MRNTIRVLVLALLAGLAACSGDKHTKPVANQRPEVKIIAGVADSAATSYRVRFEWRGTDRDGIVTRYQFAVDDTAAAAWRDTTTTSALQTFRADQFDPGDPDVLTRWHSFFVRAIDDEGAVSRPDSRVFNARNIAPSTRITSPDPHSGGLLHLCRTVKFEWVGEDLDSSRLDHMPRYWEYKEVRLPTPVEPEEAVIDSLLLGRNLLLEPGSEDRPESWVRVPTERRSVLVHGIAPGGAYAFAVRGVDEGGATEPRLIRQKNFIDFLGLAGESSRFLTVTEPSLGRFTFPLNGEEWNVTVPAGRPHRFRFIFDCFACGERAPQFKYGLDLPDFSDSLNVDPNGQGGWTAWSTVDHTEQPIQFSANDGAADHTLWVATRCALDPNQYRMARINLHVVSYTFEKFALLVDDARMGQSPTDEVHDAFLRDHLLRRAQELGEVTEFVLFGSAGDERRAPIPNDLPLDVLVRYQHIFWSEQLGVNTQTTGLHSIERDLGRLGAYQLAGGRLFVFGGNVAGTLVGARFGNFAYPKTPPNNPSGDPPIEGFEYDSFLWRFMHARSYVVGVPTGGPSEVKAASSLVAARSLHPGFPDLMLDASKWPKDELLDCNEDSTQCHFRGGLTTWEGIQGGNGTTQVDAGLDSLYAAVTFNQVFSTETHGPREVRSPYEGAIVGQRFQSTRADTINGTAQGRMVWFGVQPWYLEPTSLEQAGRAAIDWLVTGR